MITSIWSSEPYDNGLPSRQRLAFSTPAFLRFQSRFQSQQSCWRYWQREGVISERTAQKWFLLLKKGKLHVTDSPRSGRPV
ncbi:hypothetical protein T10_11534 [Trichinella papuae]|uniref:Uncharacterized protein n=1 Tax=Trichinella papuae TaxID=268474 RepID=A0A0V1M418_9BILA|nr:hypothetical protein T10_11534 [Trichinella papuae]